MKVAELRNLLGEAEKEPMAKAFVEVYKLLPKSRKEEIDDTITAILSGQDVDKKDKNEVVNFDQLEQTIQFFLENAYAQNYFAPNRIIPKAQRPKWRFLVKNYIKELQKIPPESPYHARSVTLFRDLYRMLCYGCNCYIFSTDDPFRSVGWDQPELFHVLVKKTFAQGYPKESVRMLLFDACGGGLSRECLHVSNMLVLLSELKTSDVKYLAIEAAQELVNEIKEKYPVKKGQRGRQYEAQERINCLSGMVLMLSVLLAEPDDGIKYFFANCERATSEIVLYCALDFTDYVGDDQDWIRVYEYGLKKKIKPREELVKEYEERKKEADSPQES